MTGVLQGFLQESSEVHCEELARRKGDMRWVGEACVDSKLLACEYDSTSGFVCQGGGGEEDGGEEG
ncbi:hypothetical protein Tdes44962_MAKER02195 [Teratosphaeria destructans]|uniref:Uncharacterized protein n=1 Tax=Teratosphaeria destructans TaxID=418781 RepID=A0A9W7SUT7_9PEZI|nr:hypothetical protein Tdes44962_MAKER02195 [Teratosphaeria destructans]